MFPRIGSKLATQSHTVPKSRMRINIPTALFVTQCVLLENICDQNFKFSMHILICLL